MDLIEIEERRKFEKSSYVQKETMRAFAEMKTHEFRLILKYRPQDTFIGLKETMNKIIEKERQTQVNVDLTKLNGPKSSEYLS